MLFPRRQFVSKQLPGGTNNQTREIVPRTRSASQSRR